MTSTSTENENIVKIRTAISVQQKAVELAPPDSALRPRMFGNLGTLYGTLFSLTGDLAILQEAIIARQKCIELTPPGDPELPGILINLGNSFKTRFIRTGHPVDIQEAIIAKKKAIEVLPPDHTYLPTILDDLGTSLQLRFERTGDLADVHEAISAHQKATELAPPGHTGLNRIFLNLGSSLETLFRRTGNLEDIQKAVSMQEKAVELTPQGNTNMPVMLGSLGNSFQTMFQVTGDPAYIQEAISVQKKAVELTPLGHRNRAAMIGNLGLSFQTRFDLTGDLADAQEAISAQQQVIALTPPGQASLNNRIYMFFNLGSSFRDRFRRTGDLEDIQEAISALRKAIELSPSDHANLPLMLDKLGVSLEHRFARTRDMADIREAISIQQKAIELIPTGDIRRPGMFGGLGASFQSRFDHTGDLEDIQEAISALQMAVELTPSTHPTLPGKLSNLGSSFATRFERTRDLVDIQEAIVTQRRAVELSPPDGKDLCLILCSLAISLGHRFAHTQDLIDIQEAISAHQKAIKLAPPNHADLPRLYGNLGTAFRARFRCTEDLVDIQEAISAQQRAIELAPPNYADRPILLHFLGNAFETRSRHTGDENDFQEAISTQRKAIDSTPPEHAALVHFLRSLGDAFFTRQQSTKQREYAIEALKSFRLAANTSTGSPSLRFNAARLWAFLSSQLDKEQAPEAYAKAIELLSLTAGLDQTVHGRHQRLINGSVLSLEAAAVAFSLEMFETALEWLEQGRCIVWTQLNNLRTPLDSLRAYDQALAERVLNVSKALEEASSRTVPEVFAINATSETKMTLQAEATQHVKLAKEWEQLLVAVRKLPGFDTFLLPTPTSTLLKDLPTGGPIIIINVHEDSCDALALFSKPSKLIHIPLPDFSYDKASDLRKRLQQRLARAKIRARGSELELDHGEELPVDDEGDPGALNDSIDRAGGASRPRNVSTNVKAILKDLWIGVIKPIIKQLGYSPSAPLAEKPRIWWCSTGPLAFLPLHAAGDYNKSDGQSRLSDFAISSYTPSVTALIQRVNTPPVAGGVVKGVLMINQPDVPGLPTIPATTREIRNIEDQLAKHQVPFLTLSRGDASVQTGMANMEEYSSVHFACHAKQDTVDPLKSGFFFHNGERLELSTVIKAQLRNADLAFLSACQTSKGDEKLSEEAVHMAAGMLAGGYRGVIATMWSIQDDFAPVIADLFYKELLACEIRAGGNGINGTHAAYALHHAIQVFQASVPDTDTTFLTWVPYVHFGL